MTVQTEISTTLHDGDGATVTFGASFYFLDPADLKVALISEIDGSRDDLDFGVDYTVAGAGNPLGGSVTLLTAPSAQQKVFVQRDPPITQELRYSATGRFPAESHQEALDKATMIDQRTRRLVLRAIRVPEEEGNALTLPVASQRANKALVFDSDGDVMPLAIPQPILDKLALDSVVATVALILGNPATAAQVLTTAIAGLPTSLPGQPNRPWVQDGNLFIS